MKLNKYPHNFFLFLRNFSKKECARQCIDNISLKRNLRLSFGRGN